MRLLIFLIVFLFTESTDAAVALKLAEESQSLSSAYDCVNIVSGQYFETNPDLEIQGAANLSYLRCYETSNNPTISWAGLSQCCSFPLYANTDDKHLLAVNEREGASLPYTLSGAMAAKVSAEVYQWGYTNYTGGELSGRSNIRNHSLKYRDSRTIEISTGSGGKRVYEASSIYPNTTQLVWLLQREIRPDGHIVHFKYQTESNEPRLSRIWTTNATETCVYNSIDIVRDLDGLGYTVTANNGLSARYKLRSLLSLQEVRLNFKSGRVTQYLPTTTLHLAAVEPSHGPKTTYTEDNVLEFGYNQPNPSWLKLRRNTGEDGRYRLIDYNSAGQVSVLKAPLGTDGKEVTYAKFTYTPTSTEVLDAYGTKILYRVGDSKRIQAIERYCKDGNLYSSQRYFWGTSGNLQGQLLTRGLAIESNRFVLAATALYDDRGNVIQEDLFGNLTGKSPGEFSLNKDNRPDNSVECCSTLTTFQAEFNLPIREQRADGSVTTYQYLPNTDQMTSRLTGDGNTIFSREFRQYSTDPLLIETITDDGCGNDVTDLTGVTLRKMTRINRRTESPAMRFPAEIEERYLDLATGDEPLLKRTVYTYDARELLIREDVYDADNTLRYSQQYEYDDKRNLVAKTDALGRTMRFKYDSNKNKISERLEESGFETIYIYDFSNRLIKSEEVHDDGSCYTTSYTYDLCGNVRAVVDPYGNETTHSYDEFNRKVQTNYPPCNSASASLKTEYNILDQAIAVTDQNGHTTSTTYNIRGQPVLITYPDGTTEASEYTLMGLLAKKREKTGLYHCYTYDVLERLIRTDTHDSDGKHQYTTFQMYAGALLKQVTDPQGNVTDYKYDGAGRKILETRHGGSGFEQTGYAYDSLGRLSTTNQWYGEGESDYVAQIQVFDLLDRVVESRSDDSDGHVLSKETYEYDIRGNRIATNVYHNDLSIAKTEVSFNSHNLPTLKIDPLKKKTVIEYNHSFRNSLNQLVCQITTTDPLGNQVIITCDAMGRTVEEERKDPFGESQGKHQAFYDAVGNLTNRIDTVFAQDRNSREIITQWTYDPMNRVCLIEEAVGTNESKRTRTGYNAFGQMLYITVAETLQIHHEYDTLGRLSRYFASDTSFNYAYQYDNNNNLLQVRDLILDTVTMRKYDFRNQVVEETLGNGLKVQYGYDGLGRPNKVLLPDGSGVSYHYNPLHLAKVSRLKGDGTVKYSHEYSDYNLAGLSYTQTLIGGAGQIATQYDPLSRPRRIQAPSFSESIPKDGYDDVGNLVRRKIVDRYQWKNGFKGATECQYTYDNLYQLTGETGPATHRYSHDSLNNRLQKDSAHYTVNALNQLLEQDDTHYSYDRQGNLMACEQGDKTTRYSYDGLGRLTTVEKGPDRFVYQYDSFNRRLSKTSYTQSQNSWIRHSCQRYLYFGQNEVGAVSDSGQMQEFRVLGRDNTAEIGASVAIELGSKVYAPVSDHSGHIVALIDPKTGHLSEGYRYSAFGEEQIFDAEGKDLTESAIGNPWRFSGKRFDPETGFINFGRRYYDPAIGRWVTPDPLGFKAGPNLYAYVHNSPLTHIDLYGLYAQRRDHSFDTSYYAPPRRQTYEFQYKRPSFKGFDMPSFRGAPRSCIAERQRLDAECCRPRGKRNFLPEQPWSSQHRIEGREIPNVRVTCCPGVATSLQESIDFSRFIHDTHGGCRVDGIYNYTNGALDGCIMTSGLKGGNHSSAVYAQAFQWIQLYYEMDGQLDRIIIHWAHSMGAQIAYNAAMLLPEHIRKSIDITTIGGAKMIPEGFFGRSRNIVSSRDPVPWFADGGACARGYNIDFVRGRGIFDHSWSGKTYSRAIRKQGERFIDRYLGNPI